MKLKPYKYALDFKALVKNLDFFNLYLKKYCKWLIGWEYLKMLINF